jgi:hypothetical protein
VWGEGKGEEKKRCFVHGGGACYVRTSVEKNRPMSGEEKGGAMYGAKEGEM